MDMKPTHYERQRARMGPYLSQARSRARNYSLIHEKPWESLDAMFQDIVIDALKKGGDPDKASAADFACIYAVCELLAQQLGKDTYQFFGSREMRELEAWVLATHNHMMGLERDDRTHLADTRCILMKAGQMIAHEAAGEKVFVPSPGLASRLAVTELRGIGCEDIKLPYPAIYIDVPVEAGLTMQRSGRGREPVIGMYITHADATGNPGVYSLDSFGGKGLDFLVVGEGGGDADDTLCRFGIPLPEDRKIDDVLVEMGAYFKKRTAESYEIGFGTMVEAWINIFRWALNVIVYATWPDAEREDVIGNPEARKLWERRGRTNKTSKRKKINEQLKRLELRGRKILGRSVTVLDRQAPPPGAGTGNGKPLQIRTLVSGHWRRYHVGKNRERMEWRWIEPFWRGPKDADTNNPIHELR